MNATISATFVPIDRAKAAGKDFSSLQEAYDDPGTGISFEIRAVTGYVFQEKLLLDKIKTVTIDGGYASLSDSTSAGGATILQGTGEYRLSIRKGKLIAKGLRIR
jgi:hypothetical protein